MKKATYSEGFKEQALTKAFSRGHRTVQAVAEELNISVFTLKSWMKKPLPDDQSRTARKANGPRIWLPEERLVALREGTDMGIEDHLLALPRIGHHEHLPAVGQVEVGQLEGLHHAAELDLFVAPIKLAGFSRRKRQGHKGLGHGGTAGALCFPAFYTTLEPWDEISEDCGRLS